jgi:hypothetical protein
MSEPTTQEIEDAAAELLKDPTIMAFIEKAAKHPDVQKEVEKQLKMAGGTDVNESDNFAVDPDVVSFGVPGAALLAGAGHLAAQKSIGLIAASALTGVIPNMIVAGLALLGPAVGTLIVQAMDDRKMRRGFWKPKD